MPQRRYVVSLTALSLGLWLIPGCGARSSPSPVAAAPKRAPSPAVPTEVKQVPAATPPKAAARVDPAALDRAVLEKCKRATVLVGNFEGGKLTATGSGFVCGDGLTVVTNKHVVTGRDDTVDPCKVIFFSGTDKPQLLQVDAGAVSVYEDAKREDKKYFEKDLAVLRIPNKVAEPLKVGRSEDEAETQGAWAFGFPAGTSIRMDEADLPSPTVHSMRIERIEKKGGKVAIFQLGGSPTHGNSGGAVVNAEGEVIGVVQAKQDESAIIVYAVPTHPLNGLLTRTKPSRLVAQEWLKPIGAASEGSDGREERRSAPRRSEPEAAPRFVATRSALSYGYLDESDLSGLTAMELTVLRNEPFARRGYIFKRRELNAAFGLLDWYTPWTRSLTALRPRLSRTETRNVDFIRSYQKNNGLEW